MKTDLILLAVMWAFYLTAFALDWRAAACLFVGSVFSHILDDRRDRNG